MAKTINQSLASSTLTAALVRKALSQFDELTGSSLRLIRTALTGTNLFKRGVPEDVQFAWLEVDIQAPKKLGSNMSIGVQEAYCDDAEILQIIISKFNQFAEIGNLAKAFKSRSIDEDMKQLLASKILARSKKNNDIDAALVRLAKKHFDAEPEAVAPKHRVSQTTKVVKNEKPAPTVKDSNLEELIAKALAADENDSDDMKHLFKWIKTLDVNLLAKQYAKMFGVSSSLLKNLVTCKKVSEFVIALNNFVEPIKEADVDDELESDDVDSIEELVDEDSDEVEVDDEDSDEVEVDEVDEEEVEDEAESEDSEYTEFINLVAEVGEDKAKLIELRKMINNFKTSTVRKFATILSTNNGCSVEDAYEAINSIVNTAKSREAFSAVERVFDLATTKSSVTPDDFSGEDEDDPVTVEVEPEYGDVDDDDEDEDVKIASSYAAGGSRSQRVIENKSTRSRRVPHTPGRGRNGRLVM